MALLEPINPFPVFNIPDLLATPHLAELAEKVVDSEAKKEERRRRKRILNGEAKEKDLALERAATQSGRGKVEWRLTGEKKKKAMERLFSWGLRMSSEEGSLVHVHSIPQVVDHNQTPTTSKYPSSSSSSSAHGKTIDTTAYIPLPQPLILPLLLRILGTERENRSKVFMARTDPKRANGMTVREVVDRMRYWGEEGRWERLGDHSVEAGLQWGLHTGRIRREGHGYWASDNLWVD